MLLSFWSIMCWHYRLATERKTVQMNHCKVNVFLSINRAVMILHLPNSPVLDRKHVNPFFQMKLCIKPFFWIILQVEGRKQTFSSFDELLEKSDKPVLVDFYATWWAFDFCFWWKHLWIFFYSVLLARSLLPLFFSFLFFPYWTFYQLR